MFPDTCRFQAENSKAKVCMKVVGACILMFPDTRMLQAENPKAKVCIKVVGACILMVHKLLQQVVPHTPQTICRHRVQSVSFRALSSKNVLWRHTMSARGLVRVKKALLWQCGLTLSGHDLTDEPNASYYRWYCKWYHTASCSTWWWPKHFVLWLTLFHEH